MDHPTDLPQNGPPDAAETLEQRIHRLENALASLQDTHSVEQRILERVTERLPPPAAAHNEGVTNRLPLPGLQLPLPGGLSALPNAVHQAWLLLDLWNELRSMVRMFFDRRYSVAWTTRLTVLILVPVILLSHWWVPLAQVDFIGPIINQIVDLILAFFLFKGLSREAARYRQALALAGQPL